MKAKKHYRYRIYTEDLLMLGRSNVKKIVNFYFANYTIFYGVGVYKGAEENNMTIEIVTEHRRDDRIKNICERINKENLQECCMATIEVVATVFI